MEQDDVPDRLATLEDQMQRLMTKHQTLETQVNDFSATSSQQFAVVQQQIQQQGQTFHGQLESHAQGIQAMFTQQMEQIRGLLSKRPRDDTME
jgi:predicted  nucleic acid-binding Zn-ribbon protein